MEASLAALAPRLQLARPGPLVPVLPALQSLLPARGLQPGVAVAVTGGGTALLLALAAAATAAGTWCAAVGVQPGLVAAAEAGVDLDRMVAVDDPGPQWPAVAAALADGGVGLLLLRPPGPVHPAAAQKLIAIARRGGCALLVAGEWPGSRVRLDVVSRSWEGVGHGRGRLRARRMTVSTGGRGAAARGATTELWLPDAHGAIRAVEPIAPAGPGDRSPAAAPRGLAVV
ncbi:hypothetical protein AB0I39_27345 [Kitasatospora purpeofusca]|uniref:hypothetical protein n=1 Tax=Kitasatospora purpeofusca TaxID=67352 RepID=UPI00340EFC58